MSLLSRRTALRAGSLACLASLAGCSELDVFDAPLVDRLVFRSETGESERFRILKAYAPRMTPQYSLSGSTKRRRPVARNSSN